MPPTRLRRALDFMSWSAGPCIIGGSIGGLIGMGRYRFALGLLVCTTMGALAGYLLAKVLVRKVL